MKKVKEVLALIPARGGSKGVPRKNIYPLNGKPLISYSIEAARNSKKVTRVVVTTDDREIARISRDLGAEVPFLRPKRLSMDNSSLRSAILHALNTLYRKEGYEPDALMTIFPNYPFKRAPDLDYVVEELNSGGYLNVPLVRRQSEWPLDCLTIEKNRIKLLKLSMPDKKSKAMHIYQTCNNFYLHRLPPWRKLQGFTSDETSYTKRYRELHRRAEAKGYYRHKALMKEVDSVLNLEIDTPNDLRLAELIVEMGLVAFDSTEHLSLSSISSQFIPSRINYLKMPRPNMGIR